MLHSVFYFVGVLKHFYFDLFFRCYSPTHENGYQTPERDYYRTNDLTFSPSGDEVAGTFCVKFLAKSVQTIAIVKTSILICVSIAKETTLDHGEAEIPITVSIHGGVAPGSREGPFFALFAGGLAAPATAAAGSASETASVVRAVEGGMAGNEKQ